MPKKPEQPPKDLTESNDRASEKPKDQPDLSKISEFDQAMRALVQVPKSEVEQKDK